MEIIKSVRGMNDLLPPESARWLLVESRCRAHFERHGYQEIRTPVLESTALFSRGIGEATDIVEKEMYTFADRKGRSLTMRPEMTASCVRAYIEHSVHKREPVTRWYYIGPMFRYEKMQTGRYRQFYQIGAEAFGAAEPSLEAEQIAMIHAVYRELGIADLRVVVNSVGDASDRPAYRQALVDFLGPQASRLCADCQRRLASNPLRILDCKVPGCQEVVTGAPRVLDHLGEASRRHFDELLAYLEALEVPHEVDSKLVRGLDYYTGPVFELISRSPALGTQSTLVAGGRYDNLVESLGGPATPAAGFALGIERAVLSLPDDDASAVPRPDVYFAVHGAAARRRAMLLAAALRRRGLWVELEHRSVGMKAQFKRADKLGARFVVALGDTEINEERAAVRDMRAGSASGPVPLPDLVEHLVTAARAT
jgi:histidyl-tRNA synthetase